jgi:putative membrane protein
MMWGGGWWWLGGLFVVICMVLMFRMMGHGMMGHGGRGHEGSASGGMKDNRTDAEHIVAERFARGEISEEEYEERRRVLERHPP